jgi:hypothetical protein
MTGTPQLDLDLEPDVADQILLLAGSDKNVLITGPTGSGKSAVAQRIHELSSRQSARFFPQNCSAIPSQLVEGTLFGHKRGAFTDAKADSPGIVAAANNGTLFLDEIGELPLAVQSKLLTLLQDRKYRPIGGTEDCRTNFRLIAATNKDLLEQCNQGLFREDLYHRINVLPLTLLPLRDTPQRALRIAAKEVERSKMPEGLRAEVLSIVQKLTHHPAAWPGNIREVITFVQRCEFGVQTQERRILTEWARWRPAQDSDRLTAITPAVSPSLADRERYAGMIHDLGAGGARPKAALSRKGSLELASRLLDAFPGPLSLDDVQAVLEAKDRRTLEANVDLLVKHSLVQRSTKGIVALWPSATSTVLQRHQGEWIPAGPGTILSAAHGDRIRLEVTSKCAGVLGVMMITHGSGRLSTPVVLVDGRELPASKTKAIEIELDGAGGLEQVLLHVGAPERRGGRLVEPMFAEGIAPDSTALEEGRRLALNKWREGWLAEHLVFHTRGE